MGKQEPLCAPLMGMENGTATEAGSTEAPQNLRSTTTRAPTQRLGDVRGHPRSPQPRGDGNASLCLGEWTKTTWQIHAMEGDSDPCPA